MATGQPVGRSLSDSSSAAPGAAAPADELPITPGTAAPMKDDPEVKDWFSRIAKDESNQAAWESDYRTDDCYCVGPETRILTYDMRWVPAASLHLGDTLVGFDEFGTEVGRHWRRAVVESAGKIVLPAYRVTFDDGTCVVVSAEHLWLAKVNSGGNHVWRKTTELTQAGVEVLKPLEPWTPDTSWGAGYLAAAFEGEGSLSYLTAPHSNGAFAIRFAQLDNVMLRRVKAELEARGFSYGTTIQRLNRVVSLTISGGLRGSMRFLGIVRPQRLIDKLSRGFGHFRCRKVVRVVTTEFLGDTELVALGTSTRTFIAEGLASHNSYWRGRQRAEQFDLQHERKAQTNLIHPQVRAQLPSLYFYRPFGRVIAEPSRNDTPQTGLPERVQLLQDTGNYFAGIPETGFREATFLALKEHFWAFGCVEVGYSAEFVDNPEAQRPPLKENEDTKIPGVVTIKEPPQVLQPQAPQPLAATGLAADPFAPAAPQAPQAPGPALPPSLPLLPSEGGPSPEAAQVAQELADLKSRFRNEQLFVKFISAKQVMVSESDRAILKANDWVGYWEDYNLEDVKRAKVFKNTATLKASVPTKPKRGGKDDSGDEAQFREASADGSLGASSGESKKIRLYKIWDLRTKTKIVLAHQHPHKLLEESFDRCPLKFLRPDIDPYHFRPVPPVYNGLDPQDIHNNSMEYLRKTERATKPRWTYDDGAVKAEEIEKFERDDANYIPRKEGTISPIQPIEHPQYTQLPLQLIALSERNFAQATGVPAEARQAETGGDKTATQAMIQNTGRQVVDSFDRSVVAEWLASIIEELILLAKDKMVLSRWIAINVDRESPMALLEAMQVAKTYREIKAEDLELAAAGLSWHVTVDVESISPVAEQEQLQRILQILNFIGNPTQALLLSRVPVLLDRLLDLAGFKGGRDRDAILAALQAVVAFAQATTQPGGGGLPGLSPMPGAPAPKASVPSTPGPQAPGPQPPGPSGPTPVG